MTIAIHTVSGTSLYHRYPGQTSAQDCYVELDCEKRVLRASYNAEVGTAVPFDVWHNRTLRWSIPALRGDVANALLAEIAPLAERVCDGYESRWNGSNHVGEYSDDAMAAREEIARLCEMADTDDEHDTVSVWTADEWFGPLGSLTKQASELGITAATTDDELAAIVKREQETARAEHVDEIEGLEEHLNALRDSVKAE